MKKNEVSVTDLCYLGGKAAQMWFKGKLGDAFGWACVGAVVVLPFVVFGAVILRAISP